MLSGEHGAGWVHLWVLMFVAPPVCLVWGLIVIHSTSLGKRIGGLSQSPRWMEKLIFVFAIMFVNMIALGFAAEFGPDGC